MVINAQFYFYNASVYVYRFKMFVKAKFSIILLICATVNLTLGCTPSVTTVSGTSAPASFCSGDLLFEDNFDSLDQSKWKHENTLAGGGNWEFQW